MPTCACLGGLLTSKVGQTEGSLVDLCMQDYKSLCAVVMICVSLVDIQTDIHAHTNNISPAYMRSSAS